MLDCSLAPKLFHLETALSSLAPETLAKVESASPALAEYRKALFATEAFSSTCCAKETVVWGWTEAKKKASQGKEGCQVWTAGIASTLVSFISLLQTMKCIVSKWRNKF